MTQQNVVKTRDARIQEELWAQEDPQTVPTDLMHSWPSGNEILNEKLARSQAAILLQLSVWPENICTKLTAYVIGLPGLNQDIEGLSRLQAIEALGKSQTIGIPEEKRTGLFGLFGGKK